MSAALQLPEPTPEEAAHALWRAGDFTYLLHEGTTDPSRGQLALHEMAMSGLHRTVLAMTSRRIGKSRGNCVTSYRVGYEHPGLRIPYGAPTGGMIEEFIAPHMELLEREAPEELAPYFFKGDWCIPPYRWVHGEDYEGDRARVCEELGDLWCIDTGKISRIVMRGCEDVAKADRLRGPGALFVVLDEAGFIKTLRYVRRSVISPMFWEARSVWGEHVNPCLLVTSTPPKELDHPFVDMVAEAKAKGALFEADVYDAPHLSERDIEEAIDEAGGEESIDWQREGRGRLTVDPAVVVVPELTKHEPELIAEWPQPEHGHFDTYVIGDLAFEKLAVFAFAWLDFANDMLVVEDELTFRRATSDVMAPAIRKKEQELWPGRPVFKRATDGDAQARAELAKVTGNLLGPLEASPYGVERKYARGGTYWPLVPKSNLSAAVNALRIRARKKQIRIHPRCKTLIAHGQFGRWNKQKTSWAEVEDSEGGHHYDGLSALVYLNRVADPTHNPFPELPPGVVSDAYHIPKKQTGAAKVLGELFGRKRQ